MWKIIAVYYIVLNILGWLLMRHDKRQAQNKSSRVPERRLFLIAWLGGAYGIAGAMRKYRHKTLHGKFVWGIPVLCLLHAGIVAWIAYGWTGLAS